MGVGDARLDGEHPVLLAGDQLRDAEARVRVGAAAAWVGEAPG